MFDNVLSQNVTNLLIDDLARGTLPQSLLFSGPEGSGKLTCALELSRVLSCTGEQKGEWSCLCPSCAKHKALVHHSLLIVGSKECSLEIDAAKRAFLDAVKNNASYLVATRYLFMRSVRKLTLRFSPILWEGDDKLSKMASLVASIDELLEEIHPVRSLPAYDKLVETCELIADASKKLENSFLYDSIPILHIRNAETWAHLTTGDDSKKMLIIENADRMQENVRNALLKILEEPPRNVHFVLTTSRRGAVMPTILSRVRNYPFVERNAKQQEEVIQRVFHDNRGGMFSVSSYLESFLPLSHQKLSFLACSYLLTIATIPPLVRRVIMQQFNPRDAIPLEMIIAEAHNFEPKILFTLFLKEILQLLRLAMREKGISAQEQDVALAWLNVVRNVNENASLFNQSIPSALEYLSAELSSKAVML